VVSVCVLGAAGSLYGRAVPGAARFALFSRSEMNTEQRLPPALRRLLESFLRLRRDTVPEEPREEES
jgi:hypothetical protein